MFDLTVKCFQLEFLENWPGTIEDLPSGFRADKEWCEDDHVIEIDGDEWFLGLAEGDVVTYSHPSLATISFGLTRNDEYYLENVYLIMFFIVLGSFAVVAVEHYYFGERGALAFTALLTVVAFKFVVTETIPKTNYFCYLDYYMLLGFFLVFLVIAEGFAVSQVFFEDNSDAVALVDFYFYSIVCTLWCGVSSYVLVNSFLGTFHEPWDEVKRRQRREKESHQRMGTKASMLSVSIGPHSDIYRPKAPVSLVRVHST